MEKIIKFTRLLNTRQKIVKEVFEVFYKALKGKCLIVYFGLFKEVMTKFKNGELDEYQEKDLTKYVYAILYNWGDKEYIELEKRLLTADEIQEINGLRLHGSAIAPRSGGIDGETIFALRSGYYHVVIKSGDSTQGRSSGPYLKSYY